jgi:hypothetical protein
VCHGATGESVKDRKTVGSDHLFDGLFVRVVRKWNYPAPFRLMR